MRRQSSEKHRADRAEGLPWGVGNWAGGIWTVRTVAHLLIRKWVTAAEALPMFYEQKADIRNYAAAARALDGGADPEDIVKAMAVASYEATFNALFVLTGEENIEALAESGAASMLHESLLSADPTGQKGADLFL